MPSKADYIRLHEAREQEGRLTKERTIGMQLTPQALAHPEQLAMHCWCQRVTTRRRISTQNLNRTSNMGGNSVGAKSEFFSDVCSCYAPLTLNPLKLSNHMCRPCSCKSALARDQLPLIRLSDAYMHFFHAVNSNIMLSLLCKFRSLYVSIIYIPNIMSIRRKNLASYKLVGGHGHAWHA